VSVGRWRRLRAIRHSIWRRFSASTR
jgi:hypothetical protein